MSGIKHTPGPWYVPDWSEWHVVDDSGNLIADCARNSFPDLHQAANSRLIAAAPELLAALNGCVRYMCCDTPEAGCSLEAKAAFEAARVAIAKAEGSVA
jgi:hypothetical protein